MRELSKDRYKSAPSSAKIACVALLMAAKLEQTIQPSFLRMIYLLPPKLEKKVCKADLIKLERDVIRTL